MNPRKDRPSQNLGAKLAAARQPDNLSRPGVSQLKTVAASQARRTPEPPPAYRPQPVPKVLQTKLKAGNPHPERTPANFARPSAPRLSRPATQPAIRQPRVDAARPKPVKSRTETVAAPARPVVQRTAAAVQLFKPGVVQAVKIYPNLHPGAVERVEPSSVFRLESFTDQYRLRKADGHGVYVPNQQYNFVRTTEGSMLLHGRYRHPSIAEGRQVLYAGEAFFNNGRLEWWSNGSGHYQPDAEDAAQAALPMDSFYTYQQIIKGEHKRRKS